MNDLRYLLWANDRQMWWRIDGNEAGRFTEAEALRHVAQSALAGRVSEATVMVADHPAVTA